MRLLITLITILALTTSTVNAQSNANELQGNWKVDLRPSPDAKPYYQPFIVTEINGSTFEGTFYGSKIENGFINKNWNRLYFAFSTADKSSKYYHSGYILDGRVYGISYCLDRKFTSPWVGSKK